MTMRHAEEIGELRASSSRPPVRAREDSSVNDGTSTSGATRGGRRIRHVRGCIGCACDIMFQLPSVTLTSLRWPPRITVRVTVFCGGVVWISPCNCCGPSTFAPSIRDDHVVFQ